MLYCEACPSFLRILAAVWGGLAVPLVNSSAFRYKKAFVALPLLAVAHCAPCQPCLCYGAFFHQK